MVRRIPALQWVLLGGVVLHARLGCAASDRKSGRRQQERSVQVARKARQVLASFAVDSRGNVEQESGMPTGPAKLQSVRSREDDDPWEESLEDMIEDIDETSGPYKLTYILNLAGKEASRGMLEWAKAFTRQFRVGALDFDVKTMAVDGDNFKSCEGSLRGDSEYGPEEQLEDFRSCMMGLAEKPPVSGLLLPAMTAKLGFDRVLVPAEEEYRVEQVRLLDKDCRERSKMECDQSRLCYWDSKEAEKGKKCKVIKEFLEGFWEIMDSHGFSADGVALLRANFTEQIGELRKYAKELEAVLKKRAEEDQVLQKRIIQLETAQGEAKPDRAQQIAAAKQHDEQERAMREGMVGKEDLKQVQDGLEVKFKALESDINAVKADQQKSTAELAKEQKRLADANQHLEQDRAQHEGMVGKEDLKQVQNGIDNKFKALESAINAIKKEQQKSAERLDRHSTRLAKANKQLEQDRAKHEGVVGKEDLKQVQNGLEVKVEALETSIDGIKANQSAAIDKLMDMVEALRLARNDGHHHEDVGARTRTRGETSGSHKSAKLGEVSRKEASEGVCCRCERAPQDAESWLWIAWTRSGTCSAACEGGKAAMMKPADRDYQWPHVTSKTGNDLIRHCGAKVGVHLWAEDVEFTGSVQRGKSRPAVQRRAPDGGAKPLCCRCADGEVEGTSSPVWHVGYSPSGSCPFCPGQKDRVVDKMSSECSSPVADQTKRERCADECAQRLGFVVGRSEGAGSLSLLQKGGNTHDNSDRSSGEGDEVTGCDVDDPERFIMIYIFDSNATSDSNERGKELTRQYFAALHACGIAVLYLSLDPGGEVDKPPRERRDPFTTGFFPEEEQCGGGGRRCEDFQFSFLGAQETGRHMASLLLVTDMVLRVTSRGLDHMARQELESPADECHPGYIAPVRDGRQDIEGFIAHAVNLGHILTLKTVITGKAGSEVDEVYAEEFAKEVTKHIFAKKDVESGLSKPHLQLIKHADTGQWKSGFKLISGLGRLIDRFDEEDALGKTYVRALKLEEMYANYLGQNGQNAEQCNELRSGMTEVMLFCRRLARRSPLLSVATIDLLWHAWQSAEGIIRIYVKVTSPCVGSGQGMKSPETNRWVCGPPQPRQFIASRQFPTAVAQCARADDVDLDNSLPPPDQLTHLKFEDSYVRYLGCGNNRVSVEPRTDLGARQMCIQGGEIAADPEFYTKLCPNPERSDPGKACGIFGPFPAIYSGKLVEQIGKGFPDLVAELTEAGMNTKCPKDIKGQCIDPGVGAFKAMIKGGSGSNEYLYGDIPAHVADPLTESTPWLLPPDRLHDPPLAHSLLEVNRGNTIIMMAYGFSGAGKTVSLVGSNAAQGVITLYLEKNTHLIRSAKLSIVEVYGRLHVDTGEIREDAGSGLWGYQLAPDFKSTQIKYWKNSDFSTGSGESEYTDFEKIKSRIEEVEVELRKTNDDKLVAKDLGLALEQVEKKREQAGGPAGASQEQDQDSETRQMAHIRPTPNNPKSSRGTLFVFLTLTFKDSKSTQGQIVVVDMAGMETPSTMIGTYLQVRDVFPPETAPDLKTQEKRRRVLEDKELPCTKEGEPREPDASRKLIEKNMWQLRERGFIDSISECIEFRDILDTESCSLPNEKKTGCFPIKVKEEEMQVKVVTQADPTFLRATPNCLEQSKGYHNFEMPETTTKEARWVRGVKNDRNVFALQSNEREDTKKKQKRINDNTCDDIAQSFFFTGSDEVPRHGDSAKANAAKLHKSKTEKHDAIKPFTPVKAAKPITFQELPRPLDIRWTACKSVAASITKTKACRYNKVTGDCSNCELEDIGWAELSVCGNFSFSLQEVMDAMKDSTKIKTPWNPQTSRTSNLRNKETVELECGGITPLIFQCEGSQPDSQLEGVAATGKEPCVWPDRLLSNKVGKGGLEKVIGKVFKYDKPVDIDKFKHDFWCRAQEYVTTYSETLASAYDKYNEHVEHFVQVISPLLEEAMYINEMLNQVKKYLEGLAKWRKRVSRRAQQMPDVLKDDRDTSEYVLPEHDVQEYDWDEFATLYVQPLQRAASYDIKKFVQAQGHDQSYYEKIHKQGLDRVLGISMFEHIRRETVNRNAGLKVLLGAFVRTDIPNGDFNCAGALSALQFVQDLMVELDPGVNGKRAAWLKHMK